MVLKPAGPCSSMTGSAKAGTPNCAREGPMARRRTCLAPDPVIMKPPMPTLSSVWTSIRVERLRGRAGPGEGVGVELGVGVGLGVGDNVGVGVGVGVGQTPSVATIVSMRQPGA